MIRAAVAFVLLASGLVACGDNGSSSKESSSPPDNQQIIDDQQIIDIQQIVAAVRDWSSPLPWEVCADLLECSQFEVPYDYANPDLGTFVLPVARHRADDPANRIGTLLINPGGPGGAALEWVGYVDQVFSKVIVDRFDIVAWDPRGVGASNPSIDCVDSMDEYFALDPSPDDQSEIDSLVTGAKSFADACVERSAGFLPYVGTVDAASDMDVLRRSLGEEEISYLGFSYGTKLGSTWATLFPETVRAAVLDAAVDPTRGYVDDLILQAGGFESSLDAFLEQCDSTTCSFMNTGEGASSAFDRIMLELDQSPIVNDQGRPATNQGVAQTAVADTLYGDYRWSELEDALSAAQGGDGQPLLLLFDDYFGRNSQGITDNSIDAYFAISCIDADRPTTNDQILGLKQRLLAVAPRLGPGWIQEMLICANWSVRPRGALAISAETRNRIVVVGSTGDAATPLEGAINMVEALGRARLVISPLDQHTTYGTDTCVTRIVDDYLVTLAEGPNTVNC